MKTNEAKKQEFSQRNKKREGTRTVVEKREVLHASAFSFTLINAIYLRFNYIKHLIDF